MPHLYRTISRLLIFGACAAIAPSASAIGSGLSGRADASAASTQAPRSSFIRDFAAASAVRIAAEREYLHKEAQEDERVVSAIQTSAAKLRPGSYVWRPERAETGDVEIVVSIAAQRAYVFRQRKLIAISTVSTGRPGHETPTGTYPILEKKREHFSNLYDGAPMPNMQRLTWDGIAFHAGAIPGRPASHGCVRLPMEFSRLLFGITRTGSVTHIVEGKPPNPRRALSFAEGQAGGGATRLAAR